ncbi:dermonecrotic toxin domain-containing protein [Pseudomonas sp. B22129]|uniref:dermonecrotic toxin domain-containing protein n=1 Tax=Pseudomonas sp. B22129 TaxID=3235111 RepID=UPI003783320A
MASTLHPFYHLTLLRRTAQDIQALFSSRSPLPVIAAQDLQRTLRASFPSVAITDEIPVILTPRYRYSGTTIEAEQPARCTLVEALVNRFVDGIWVDYTQGQQLTAEPDSAPLKISPLKNLDAQDAVNRRAPLLLKRCQQALIDDWTELSIEARSRFETLSLLLKDTLRHLSAPTLIADATHRQMINDVLKTPDNNLRSGTTRAYLVDQWGEFGSEQLELLRGMLIVRQTGTDETLLLFTLSAGIEAFASRDALGKALRTRLGGLAPGRAMQWRLYEPRCNIFDGFALSFLVKQLSDLQWGVALARRSSYWDGALLDSVHWIATGDFDSLSLANNPALSRLYGALPPWMKRLRRELRGVFSQKMHSLSRLFKQPNWRFFDDGVPSLLDFTRQKLMAAYPQSSRIEPDDVIITIHTVRGVSAAGGFPVKIITTLLKVALENLAGLPGDAIQVSLRNGSAPPNWLTPSAIKRMVSQVDIGENYPRQVALVLRDSPAEVLWRSRSFIAQLRLELPMLALEFYSRGQSGFSRKGYEMVAAVMQEQAVDRYVDDQVIVLRPLAFKVSASAEADVATNMFVIGPRSLDVGPVVLLHSMGQPKLMEFVSRQDLLSAIEQPGVLQQQVLGWMSADARAIYRDDGFVAPHFNTMDGLALLIDALASKPVMLAADEVQGDYGRHLYDSQVRAVLEQADKQSVSNSENSWARRMEGLSLGLNSVMPLVSGPLAVVGWLQVAWAVHEQIAQVSQSDTDDQGSTLVGFFLSMALVLMHYSSDVSATVRREDEVQEERLSDPLSERVGEAETYTPKAEAPPVQLPDMDAGQDVSAARGPIEYGWLPTLGRLTPSQVMDLQTFSMTKPAGATQAGSGVTSGLWLSEGQWYADVDTYCFKVSVERDNVRVVAANGRRGPWLKSAGNGRWVLDLRLRLQGGAGGEEANAAPSNAELMTQFNTLYGEFSGARIPERTVVEVLRTEGDLNRRLQAIERRNDSVALMQQRAKLLVELLQQRRLAGVVQNYSRLLHQFLEAQVRCLRFQIGLMDIRRLTLYEQLTNDTGFKPLTLREVAKRTPPESMRIGLDLLVKLHEQTVALCREQRIAYERILDTVSPADTQVSTLDIAEWNDKAPILAWWEAGLRPLVLRCLKAKVESPGMEAFNLLEEVNLRCRLKLSSYRQLCLEPSYSLAQRRLLVNDAVDELAWLDDRLARVGDISNSFIEPGALGDYRNYIRAIREEMVRDLLGIYEDYYDSQAVLPLFEEGPLERVIQSRHYGRLIAAPQPPSGIGDAMDFIDPYTRIVYASFAKKVETNGDTDWVLRPVSDVQSIKKEPQGYFGSLLLTRRGSDAIEALASQEQNMLVAPRAVRANLELLAEELLLEVQRTSERRNQNQQRDPAQALLDKTLTNKANELIRAGRESYQRMVLSREPTTAGIADLLAEGVIEIKAVGESRPNRGTDLSPVFRSFYVQKVAPSQGPAEILWFAHFHYPPGHTRGALGFYFAHLKAVRGPLANFEQQLRAAQGNNEQVLSIYRTIIERKAALALFFNNELPSAQ